MPVLEIPAPEVVSTTSSLSAFVKALKPGEYREVHPVTWEEYEALLDDLKQTACLRISYAEGYLEVMAPLPEHETDKDTIFWFVTILVDELRIKCKSFGSTTYKRKDIRRGGEPDASFYLQNVEKVIGKRKLNLATDPPPDIVVEIDVTHPSTKKLETYAKLGVPEVWVYNGKRFRILVLHSDSYFEQKNSHAFPFLTADEIVEFLKISQDTEQFEATTAFRNRIREKLRKQP